MLTFWSLCFIPEILHGCSFRCKDIINFTWNTMEFHNYHYFIINHQKIADYWPNQSNLSTTVLYNAYIATIKRYTCLQCFTMIMHWLWNKTQGMPNIYPAWSILSSWIQIWQLQSWYLCFSGWVNFASCAQRGG